jgi:LysR family hydrogen peroxide-inducible transcriptional activator
VRLKEIQYFLAICEEGTFTGAANRCGVSQPSLSNAIIRMERKLGGLLFYRKPTNVSLSKLGQQLRPYFENMNQCAERIYREAEQLTTKAG